MYIYVTYTHIHIHAVVYCYCLLLDIDIDVDTILVEAGSISSPLLLLSLLSVTEAARQLIYRPAFTPPRSTLYLSSATYVFCLMSDTYSVYTTHTHTHTHTHHTDTHTAHTPTRCCTFTQQLL